VVETFGRDVLDASGALDRQRMRTRVFADPVARSQLEEILHPLILEEMARRSARAGGPYQILVIPLLAETRGRQHVDRVLVVDCPVEVQMARLKARDAENERQARSMIAAQASRAERLALADDVITNDGDLASLETQIEALDHRYRELSRSPRRS
jgi:dephospho-CoA kinase